MQTEQILFKEFDSAANRKGAGTSPFLPGGRAGREVPPPPPTFSQEDLDLAKKEAHKQGLAEGIDEGKRQQQNEQATIHKALLSSLAGINQMFMPLVDDYKKTVTALRSDMPRVALAAAKKAAGKALDENAQSAISETVEKCLASLPDVPEITLHIHESMAATLEEELKQMAQSAPHAAYIKVQGNADMPQTDCKISWKDGALLRDTQQIWQNIETAIDKMAAGEQFKAEGDMEKLGQENTSPQAPVQPETAQAQPAEYATPAQTLPTNETQPPKQE